MNHTLTELIACADREVVMRMRVYPGWVKDQRMGQEKADAEVAAMTAIRAVLRAARAGEPLPVAPEQPQQAELL